MGARVTPSVRDGERLQVSRPPDLTMMTIRLLSLEIQIFSVRASPFTSLTEEGGHVPVLGPRQGRGPAPPTLGAVIAPRGCCTTVGSDVLCALTHTHTRTHTHTHTHHVTHHTHYKYVKCTVWLPIQYDTVQY